MSSQTMSHCVVLVHLVGIRNATAVQTCVTRLAKSGGDRELTLVKICPTQNKVVDFLAKLSRMGHLTDLWLQDDPDHIADLSAADCNLVNWSIKYRLFAQKSQFSPRFFSKIVQLAHPLILNPPTNDTPSHISWEHMIWNGGHPRLEHMLHGLKIGAREALIVNLLP